MLRFSPNPARLWLQRPSVRVSLAAVVGLSLGFVAVPQQLAPEDPHAPPPPLMLLGAPLPADNSAGEQALTRLREHFSGTLLLDLDGSPRPVSYADLGVAIDTVRLTQLVQDSRDATSPLQRTRRRQGLEGPIVLPLPTAIDETKALTLLRRFKDELDQPPADARIDTAARSIVPERVGRVLDLDATVGAIERALASGTPSASAVLHIQKPKRTAQTLAEVRFEQVLAFFETPYDRSEKAKARTFNLRHAAQKIDGTVLLPGETFDFNEIVGPRDEAHGFQVAQVIAEGELVDGIGGGTCQISGTLHAAAFFAGLEVLERHPHTRPSSYIKLGLDAAVVYPRLNLRLKNNFSFPVVLRQTVEGGVVRAEVLGAEVGPAVTLIRRIESATDYDQIERTDDRLAQGKRSLFQRGVPGFAIKRYRIVRNGEHALRDVWHDTYPPTTQIVLVGSNTDAKKDTSAPARDTHPEYLADELLVLTKQRATPQDPTRFSERREPGRYGEPGWSKAAGMPHFEGS